MAKGSGGTRGASGGGGRTTYFSETEKAVQLSMTVNASYSGTSKKTGFWEDKQKSFTQKVWIPKSQMKGGKPTEWIAKQKAKDILKANNPYSKGLSPIGTFKITDAKGKTISTAKG